MHRYALFLQAFLELNVLFLFDYKCLRNWPNFKGEPIFWPLFKQVSVDVVTAP